MKKLTKIDKYIVGTLIIICCIVSLMYITIASKVIAVIGLLSYGFFILMHLGFGFPLFCIWLATSDFFDELSIKIGLKQKSLIIHWFVFSILLIIVLTIIYCFVPVLFAMLYNNSFSFKEAIDFLNNPDAHINNFIHEK